MGEEDNYARELEVAVRVVHVACALCGRVQERLLATSNDHVVSKDDDSPVTVADLSVQATVSWLLSEIFGVQNVSIVAEEDTETFSKDDSAGLLEAVVNTVNESLAFASKYGLQSPERTLGTSEVLEAIGRCNSTGGPGGRHWVLDPVDGTLGFVRGDQYAVALALIEDGKVVLGVLGCPNYPVKTEWLNYHYQYHQTTSQSSPTTPDAWGKGCVLYARRGSGEAWLQSLIPGDKMLEWPNFARPIQVSSTDDPALATLCEPVERANSNHSFTAGLAHTVGLRKQPLRVHSMVKYAAIARGLTSGLELGPTLDKAQEIKAELERLKKMKEREKMAAHFQSSGTILANMSLPEFLRGDSLFKGMAMTSEIQSQLSKRNAVTLSGNLAVDGRDGGGAATAVFRHQLSEVSSIEFVGSAGLRALVGVQTSRNISLHSTATMGIAMSLKDGSLNLSNLWTRQLSDTASGHIQLTLGPQSSVAVGWQKKDERGSASGEVKFGTGSFETSAHYSHRFSSKSLGCIGGRVGSSSLEIEVGGGRKLSKFSTVRWMYVIGIQGISWKFELYRGGQKLIFPILLSKHLNPVFATGAFVVPASLYFVVKKFLIKPYYLKRNKQKALEKEEKTSTQVQEARAAAEKSQKLQQNVANRKRNKQLETGGLVIMRALYGNQIFLDNLRSSETSFESTSEIIDVTTPMNFLVNDSGQLKLHEGVKKSGIMGFCDPCPGERKQLYVEYVNAGNQHKVWVGDYEELLIPQGTHMI